MFTTNEDFLNRIKETIIKQDGSLEAIDGRGQWCLELCKNALNELCEENDSSFKQKQEAGDFSYLSVPPKWGFDSFGSNGKCEDV